MKTSIESRLSRALASRRRLATAALRWRGRARKAEDSLRVSEAHLATAEQVANMGPWARRCIGCSLAARLLRAAQSLHRAWMRDTSRLAAERDTLRAENKRLDLLVKEQLAGWGKSDNENDALRAEVASLTEKARRDAAAMDCMGSEVASLREQVVALDGAQRRSAYATRNLCEYVHSFILALAVHDKPHQDHFQAQVEAWAKSAERSFEGVPEETICDAKETP